MKHPGDLAQGINSMVSARQRTSALEEEEQ